MSDLLNDLLQGTQAPLFELRTAAYNEIIALRSSLDSAVISSREWQRKYEQLRDAVRVAHEDMIILEGVGLDYVRTIHPEVGEFLAGVVESRPTGGVFVPGPPLEPEVAAKLGLVVERLSPIDSATLADSIANPPAPNAALRAAAKAALERRVPTCPRCHAELPLHEQHCTRV